MTAGPEVVAFEVYGTRVSVRVPSADLVARVVERFPRHSVRSEPGTEDRRFELAARDDGLYAVLEDGRLEERDIPLDSALNALRRRLFFHAVEHARDRLVVSAGVVASEGRAILLPGRSMAGKTRLVAALVRAGAVYYADDWGVIDADGLVHPFLTTLFFKNEGRVAVESIGGARGEEPVPLGLIAALTYRPDGGFAVERRTAGEGALMLLRHAYGLDEPGVALGLARGAVSRALVVEGERGEAGEAAAALLELAAQAPPPV